MALIELSNIKKSYGKGDAMATVLHGVSLQIEKGEFVAVVGASGSGKTTLMNLIGLLDRPDEGDYLLEQKDVSRLKKGELAKLRRNKIGFIFQNFNLVPRLNAYANIELPMVYAKVSSKDRRFQTNKLLNLVGLSEQKKNLPNQLSGGQMQRVAIARALANRPELILADEPTGNLDSHTGERIMKVFKKLNQYGNTIILITHDRNVARYADRTITIKDGNVSSQRNKK